MLDSDANHSGWKQGEFFQHRMGYNPLPTSPAFTWRSQAMTVRTASGPGWRCILCSSSCSLFKICSLIMYLEYTITALIYTKLFLRARCVLRMPWAVRSYFALSACWWWQSITHPKPTHWGSRDINIEKRNISAFLYAEQDRGFSC